MIVGWREGRHGAELRATHADRDAVLRLLRLAEDEGRLDAAEYQRREHAVSEVKTRADLAALAADLPNRRGVPDWIDQLRVSREHREEAVRRLAEALTQGRFTVTEYQRRAEKLPAVATYANLKRVLAGLPGVPDVACGDVLPSGDDRDRALAALTTAVADGRVGAGERPALAARIERARRLADLDALLSTLDALAGDHARQQVFQRLDAAHRDGQLDADEHAARTVLAHEATTDADLAYLVADLDGEGRRPTTADQKGTADTLRRALDEGRLDLAEYDERVRAAYAAGTAAELATLVADLADPPRPPRRGIIDAAFDRWVVNSALLPSPRREILKWSWVAGTAAIPLTWFWLVLTAPVAAFLSVIFPPLAAAPFLVVKSVVARLGRTGRDRQAALIEEIRTVLEDHPDVDGVRISYGFLSELRIAAWGGWDSSGTPKPVGPSFVDEAVRLLWLSRLYPLTKIRFELTRGLFGDRNVHMIRLHSAATRDLSDRYGPRPYGPLRS